MSSNFDRILTSTPLNSTASKVTARGEHYEPETPMPPGFMHWKAPPLMKPFKGEIDFTGKKFGHFTVVGLMEGGGGKNRGPRWICRCVCGDYEARSAQTIKLALASLVDLDGVGYKCWICAQWQIAKGRYAKKGAKPLSTFINAAPRTIEKETKSPDTIIAEKLAKLIGSDEGCLGAAVGIIAKLNKSGYRIVRDTHAAPQPC